MNSQELGRSLRKTNWTLGTDDVEYRTVANESYGDRRPKGLPHVPAEDEAMSDPKKKAPQLQRSNVKLGHGPGNYLSEYEAEYYEKHAKHDRSKSQHETEGMIKRIRQTNFVLGVEQPEFNSTSHGQFADPASRRGGNPADVADADAVKKEMQKVHFKLGSDRTPYETSYKTMTGGDLDSGVAAAKETAADGKNRTRASQRTSYALGTDPNDYHTEVQDRYRGEQNAESTTLNAELQKDLRAVHFKLGSDKPDYVSNYKAQHDDKSGQAERSVGHAELSKDLRRTNWSMGSDDVDYSTVMTSSYGDRRGRELPVVKSDEEMLAGSQPQAKSRELQRSHVMLGSGKGEYESEFTAEYTKKHPDGHSKSDTEGMIKRIRQTNFVLGMEQPDFTSTSHGQFADPASRRGGNPADVADADAVKKEMQKVHFKLGSDRTPYETSYKTMTGGDLDSAVAAAKETAADGKNRTRASQRTSYALGTDPNDYHTEVQDRYRGEQNAESTTLNAELQKDLRAVHFKLGSDKPDYVSNYKAQHDDKSGQAERSVGHAELSKDLRRTNWSMGSDDVDYSTVMTSSYGDRRGRELPVVKSDEEMLAGSQPQAKSRELQRSHVMLGSGKGEYESEFKANYTKKPIDRGGAAALKERSVALRRSNFVFGADSGDFKSTSTLAFHKHPLSDARGAQSELKKQIQASHIHFGTDNPKWRRKPKPQTFPAKPPSPLINSQALQGSNIVIGTQHMEYLTEVQDKYRGEQNKEKAQLNELLAKDLRSSHIKFGNSQAGDFMSMTAMTINEPARGRLSLKPSRLSNSGRRALTPYNTNASERPSTTG